MKLYFSRNLNPRLAVAVARFLDSTLEYEFAAPFDPAQRDRFLQLNPNQLLPILEEETGTLWETDAIACRLSQLARSEFWRTGVDLPEMIRWLSWGMSNFVAGCDKVHFERVTRQRYGHGPIRQHLVAEGLEQFARSAALLDHVLASRTWLVGDTVSYADFRMACVLPFADIAGLPLRDFRHVEAWYARLDAIDAWRDPFDGLSAPPLPAIPAELHLTP